MAATRSLSRLIGPIVNHNVALTSRHHCFSTLRGQKSVVLFQCKNETRHLGAALSRWNSGDISARSENQQHNHWDSTNYWTNNTSVVWASLCAAGVFVGANILKTQDDSVEAAGFLGKKSKAPDASKFMLYWASGSPPCWRVMLALEEKGIHDYPNDLLSMDKQENKRPDVLKLNPKGQIPTFSHDGNVINESLAIVEYLEATFKSHGTKLLPEDSSKLALVLQRKYEAEDFFKLGIKGYFFYSVKKAEDQTQAESDERLQTFRDQLAMWENYMKEMGPNSYIAGTDFSMADVVFFPTIALMWRLGLRLEQYPNIQAYFERTRQRPSVQKTWPPHWKKGPRQTYLANV